MKFIEAWKSKDKKARTFLLLGGLFLLLAMVGVVLPVIPQVPFAIIAAYFFSKGSPSIHRWTRNNRFFGKAVRDWEDERVLRPRLKVLSVVSMIVAAGLGHWKAPLPWAIALDVAFLAASVFVLTRNSGSSSKV